MSPWDCPQVFQSFQLLPTTPTHASARYVPDTGRRVTPNGCQVESPPGSTLFRPQAAHRGPAPPALLWTPLGLALASPTTSAIHPSVQVGSLPPDPQLYRVTSPLERQDRPSAPLSHDYSWPPDLGPRRPGAFPFTTFQCTADCAGRKAFPLAVISPGYNRLNPLRWMNRPGGCHPHPRHHGLPQLASRTRWALLHCFKPGILFAWFCLSGSGCRVLVLLSEPYEECRGQCVKT